MGYTREELDRLAEAVKNLDFQDWLMGKIWYNIKELGIDLTNANTEDIVDDTLVAIQNADSVFTEFTTLLESNADGYGWKWLVERLAEFLEELANS